jgi:hypothetical protein
MKHLYLFAILLFFTLFAKAQQVLPYKNPQLPVEARVADLLGRMTPEEKFRQLFMIGSSSKDIRLRKRIEIK